MNKFTDETPIAMLTVGQLKEILGIDRILGNLTAHQTPTEQVMTVEEVVRLTGYSKATIYKFTSERKIPFRKPEHGGRRLYFQREEILDWLQSELHPTIEQENIQRINQFLDELPCKRDKPTAISRRGEQFHHFVGGICHVGTFKPHDDLLETGKIVRQSGLHIEQISLPPFFDTGGQDDSGTIGIPFRWVQLIAEMNLFTRRL